MKTRIFHQLQPQVKQIPMQIQQRKPQSSNINIRPSGKFKTFDDRIRKKLLVANDVQFAKTQNQFQKQVQSENFINKINQIVSERNTAESLEQQFQAQLLQKINYQQLIKTQQIQKCISPTINSAEFQSVERKKKYKQLKIDNRMNYNSDRIPTTPTQVQTYDEEVKFSAKEVEQLTIYPQRIVRSLSRTKIILEEIVFDYQNELVLDKFLKNNTVFLGDLGINIVQLQCQWNKLIQTIETFYNGSIQQIPDIINNFFNTDQICIFLINFCRAPFYVNLNKNTQNCFVNYFREIYIKDVIVGKSVIMGQLINEIMKLLQISMLTVFQQLDVLFHGDQLLIELIITIIKFTILGFRYQDSKWIDSLGESI